jgi:hypothetical protein
VAEDFLKTLNVPFLKGTVISALILDERKAKTGNILINLN